MLFLPRNLGRMSELASQDSITPATMGVRVLEYDDQYRLEAIDGQRCIVVRGSRTPQQFDKLADALDAFPNGTFDGVIPADKWAAAFKGAPKDSPVALVMGNGSFAFAFGNETISGKLIAGRFPKVDELIPSGPSKTVPVNVRKMVDILNAIIPLAGENGTVVFHVYEGAQPVGISCLNESGQLVDALVMPHFENKVAHARVAEPAQIEDHSHELNGKV